MDLSGSWGYIQRVSKSRLANNKTINHVSEYGEDIELMGTAGEIAARRFLGLDETLHIGFDDGVDFQYNGWTVDVKATKLTPRVDHRFLQLPIWKPIKANIIMLTAVNIENKSAVVLGYAKKIDILNAPVNNERKDPCHEIPVLDLIPAWKLIMKNSGR